MKTILLLHGALGSKEDLVPLHKVLCSSFHVHSINFYGHDGKPVDEHFSIEGFARQVLDWMLENDLQKINLAGYNLGGYVALYLALFHPEKIEKVLTLGTKLYWDAYVAEREISNLNLALMEEKFPDYAQTLRQKHSPENWKTVVAKTTALLRELGTFNPIKFEDFSAIKVPVMLLLGDRDKMVSFVETTTVYKELPNAQLTILPNTHHHLGQVNTALLAPIVTFFFLN